MSIPDLTKAYKTILGAADGTANNDSLLSGTAPFTTIGVTGLTNPSASLLSDVVDGLTTDKVDDVRNLQDLATAAQSVITGATGGTASTQKQLETLGITGLTGDNLAAHRQSPPPRPGR
jgi:hypothetical protein